MYITEDLHAIFPIYCTGIFTMYFPTSFVWLDPMIYYFSASTQKLWFLFYILQRYLNKSFIYFQGPLLSIESRSKTKRQLCWFHFTHSRVFHIVITHCMQLKTAVSEVASNNRFMSSFVNVGHQVQKSKQRTHTDNKEPYKLTPFFHLR